MNDSFDPLESELSALRPQLVSTGLRDRIAASLDPAAPGRPSSENTGWLVLTACIAAACLLFVFVRWPLWRNLPEAKNSVPHAVPQASVLDKPLPTKGETNGSAAAMSANGPDRNQPAFNWPLYETPPMKAYASIPADLLD